MSSGIEVALFYREENGFEVEITEMYDGKDGFREFYRDTYKKLLGYVSRMEELNESPEDMVQSIYCLAYRDWDRLQLHTNLTGWLYITANHISRNLRRREENNDISLELLDESAIELRIYADYDAVEWKLTAHEILTEKDRAIFDKCYLENHSSSEIAAELGISEENVRMRLSRIRKKMRNKIAR